MKRAPHFLLKFPFLVLLLFLWLGALSCSTDGENADTPAMDGIQDSVLNDSADIKGLKDINTQLKIGATFRFDEDSKYLAITENEFNASQVLFYAGFGGWPSEDNYDFTVFNESVNWLEERNIESHLHMLFGPNLYMPDWLKNGSWSAEELDAHMMELIENIMNSNDNKNKVEAWNVINELFNDDGTYRDDMVWTQMGSEADSSGLVGEENINNEHPIFIRKAFEYCRSFTNAKLEYRDYLIENNNPGTGWDKKHKATYQLLRHMLNSDIPINAVGIQGHFNIGEVDWVLQDNGVTQMVEKFKALGLEVYITEMDIGTTEEYTQAAIEQQKTDFYNYTSQAIKGGATRIYTWGIQDGRDPTWRTNEHPLLWDENLDKKEAYDGVKEALEDSKQ